MSVLESFFSLGASELLGSDNQLVKLNELMNWSRSLSAMEAESQGG